MRCSLIGWALLSLGLSALPAGSARAAFPQLLFAPENAASATQQGPIDTDFPLPVQIRLQDCRSGTCVSAAPNLAVGTLTVELPASGASATATPAGPFADAARDAMGRYPAVTFRANGQFGTYRANFVLRTPQGTVIASSAVVLKNLNGSVGPPAQVSLLTGSGQVLGVRREFPNPIGFVVVDANGNTVPGAQVTARTSSDPGVPSALVRVQGSPGRPNQFEITGSTNFAGEAFFTATANGLAGTFPLTASVAGVPATASASLTTTGVAGQFTNLLPVGGDGQSAPPETPFAQPLVVRVTDAFGGPVVNQSVRFRAPAGATASAQLNGIGNDLSVLSDAMGRAQVTARANVLPGNYDVTVSSVMSADVIGSPAELSLSFRLSNTEQNIFANGFEPAPAAVVAEPAE
jgi:hypothetical protein